MLSYTQGYPQPTVDKATRRGQSLTHKPMRSLYLKYIVFYKKIKTIFLISTVIIVAIDKNNRNIWSH